jgi:predicted nucleic acid-binding protein
VLSHAPAVADSEAVAVSRDPKDDYLVALARECGADFLVSGDQDLTALSEILPPVRTPAAFLEALATDPEG